MAQTYRDLVFMILDELKIISDDSLFEQEHVVHILNKYRALLFTQKYKGKKVEIPSAFYQRLIVEFDTTYDNQKNIYQSFKELPQILDVNGIWQYTFVSNDGMRTENLNFINPQRFKSVGYNKWLSNQIYVTIDLDRYMYVKSPLSISNLIGSEKDGSLYVDKSLISENGLYQLVSETSGNAYLYYDTILDNPMNAYTFNNEEDIDKLNYSFFCEESLIQPIIDLSVKELGMMNQQKRDVFNNASDDPSIPQQQVQQ